jgi:hypothetical protein
MVSIAPRVFYWAKMVSAKVLKKRLLMYYGKILELGF